DQLFLKTRPRKSSWIKRILPYAAAIMCEFVAGIYLYQSRPHAGDAVVSELPADPTILPGGNRSTIRLDNGTLLNLNENQERIINNGNALVYGDGSAIEVLEHTKLVTLMTPRGGQYAVTLSDGTKVWLNAASELV